MFRRTLAGSLSVLTLVCCLASSAQSQINWVERAEWRGPSVLPDGVIFGKSVSISGDYAAVGVTGEGVVYVASLSSNGFRAVQRIEAPDGDPFELGEAVSLDGDRLLIGREAQNFGAGSAYVYRRDGDRWVVEDKLLPTSRSFGNFGCAVALQGDRALIGSQIDPEQGWSAGSAFIFERQGSQWLEVAKLTPRVASEGDLAGWSVGLDGDVAVVGAWAHSPQELFQGTAYVYERTPSGWRQAAKLSAPVIEEDAYFGVSVAVSGRRIAVGATGGQGGRGAVHVFARGPLSWQLEASFEPSLAMGSQFGNALVFREDLLLIGSHRQRGLDGVIHYTERTSNGWTPLETIIPGQAPRDGQFGWAMDFDGRRLITSAAFASPTGSVFLFEPRLGIGRPGGKR